MELRCLTGAEIDEALPALAKLRIEVFRDWPYLYAGDASYEEDYLKVYTQAYGAIVVAAYDGTEMVGASTGCALTEHSDDFSAALCETPLRVEDVFYCAESVLLPAYRGRGLGHAFFDHREAQARRLGFGTSAFCAVLRPEDHPARPAEYRPLDAFWRKRGYEPLPGAIAQFDWQDICENAPSAHDLQFWCKAL